MILSSPSPTAYDLHFRMFGIPVRIHPMFWIVTLLLSGLGDSTQAADVLLWIFAVFVSILIHELGHALVMRSFGGRPRIVLYSFGGLAQSDRSDLSSWKHILISLAGPGAGFAFAALLWAFVVMAGALPIWHGLGIVELRDSFLSQAVRSLLFDLFYINVMWGVFNLLPIYPLDGGQIARELAVSTLRADRGVIMSLQLSILTAGAMVAYLLYRGGGLYSVLLFAVLGFESYQLLEAYRESRRGYH